MNLPDKLPAAGSSDEISALTEVLHQIDRRLEVLTAGEVDAVTSSQGQTFLLRRAQTGWRHSEIARQEAIINALPAQVALINSLGVVVSANVAWESFTGGNPPHAPGHAVGVNYLEQCDAAGREQTEARDIARGIRSVICGESSCYSLEYSCPSPGAVRWLLLTVTPWGGTPSSGAVVMHLDVTAQKQTDAAVVESRQRLALATESAQLGIWDWNVSANEMLWDARMHEIYGIRAPSERGTYEAWLGGIHPDDRESCRRDIAAAVAGTKDFNTEFRVVWPNGEVHDIEAHAVVQRDGDGSATRMIGVSWDITARKRSEARIAGLNRVYAILSKINALTVRVKHTDELFVEACRIAVDDGGFRTAAVAIVDKNTGLVRVVASAGLDEALLADIRGVLSTPEGAATTMVAKAIRERQAAISNDTSVDTRLVFGKQTAESGVRSLAVLPLVVADVAIGVLMMYSGQAEFFHANEIALLQELVGDITFAMDHIEKSERLHYLAYYDAVTGLANRSLFIERAVQSLRGDGVGEHRMAMILIDLARFKYVNDTFGRPIGDALLRDVAARLVHESDANLVACLGADHFAMMLAGTGLDEKVERMIEHLVAAVCDRPFRVHQAEIRLRVKIGIAFCRDDCADAELLFRNAEAALKVAKSSTVRHAFFSPELSEKLARRHEFEQELRNAVDEQQFVLHYQPRVDMISGEVVGAEALIRWQHPRRGLVAPGEFIGLAEETGLIVAIGTATIRAVCAQQGAWIAAGLETVPVAVNWSAVQFEHGGLLQIVTTALAENDLPARLLDLELTESSVMNDSDAAAATLKVLRKLGVGLTLDDFGTGYSSLAHLRRFPFHSVKIDQSFVTSIINNVEDAAIASAIIAMAHRMDLKVVAEGIETQGQFNYLRANGCDEMQGFLFSPPVPAETFETYLRSGKRLELPDRAPADLQTLLLVDDEQSIRSAVTRMLRRDGYRILSAGTGAEGLQLLALHPVQVIISDQRMPGMSGTEFLSTVKQLYPDTVRIVLSGYTDIDVVTDAVNRGAVFKFLTKPWDDAVLRDLVRDAFERHRDQRTGEVELITAPAAR
jgi:diguanylate cyclase (GGDEF)-like protein/PAS domain S-box-containing protein